MKKLVQVVITKEFEIELTPELLDGESEEEYLKNYSRYFHQVDSMNDILEYASTRYAEFGEMFLEGVGRIGMHYSTYPDIPVVKIKDVDIDYEFEVLEDIE